MSAELPVVKRKKGLLSNAAVFNGFLPLAILAVVFVFLPLVYVIVTSFMHRELLIKDGFTINNYKQIFEIRNLSIFAESLKLAFISTLLTCILGYPFGYFMARLTSVWKTRVMFLLIIPFWTSFLLRLYGWKIMFRSNGILDSFLIKLNIIHSPLKFLYTYNAVVSGMVYALLPLMIYSVYASAEKLDWELVEAARNLGASKTRAFFTVCFPLTMPGLFSGIVLTFVPSMGLFFVAEILGGDKFVLVGNTIHTSLMRLNDKPFAAALSVVLMIMTSLLIWLYRKITRSGELEGLV